MQPAGREVTMETLEPTIRAVLALVALALELVRPRKNVLVNSLGPSWPSATTSGSKPWSAQQVS